MSDPVPVGVLVMSYGSPRLPEGIEDYYTHIRGGRPPSPEQLADLLDRYAAIGGTSPLAERTAAQGRGLQAALDRRHPGHYRVHLGARHSPPFIEDAVAEMAGDGVREAVALVLAPHYSDMSVGEYLRRASASAKVHGIGIRPVRSWHLNPTLVELLAERARRTLSALPPPPGTLLVFTAHSLPARISETADPYPDQVVETARAVAGQAGWDEWEVAWQSAPRTEQGAPRTEQGAPRTEQGAPRTGEAWLGPDVTEAIAAAAARGLRAVAVCPVGFTSDHLEVLYDIDIRAREAAAAAGVELARTESLNDDPRLMEALAGVVASAS